MREHHPNSEEVVFVLLAAERAAMIVQSEPKTKKGDACNLQFKVPHPLPTPLASLVACGSASGSGSKSSNNCSNNNNGSSNVSSNNT